MRWTLARRTRGDATRRCNLHMIHMEQKPKLFMRMLRAVRRPRGEIDSSCRDHVLREHHFRASFIDRKRDSAHCDLGGALARCRQVSAGASLSPESTSNMFKRLQLSHTRLSSNLNQQSGTAELASANEVDLVRSNHTLFTNPSTRNPICT